jgi:tetratricopeptide (TPR) repeat protein
MKHYQKSSLFSLSNIVLVAALLMPIGYLFYANFIRSVPPPLPDTQLEQIASEVPVSTGFTSAIEAAEKSASSLPSFQTYLNLGLVYYQSGLYEKSIAATLQAISFDSSQAVAYNNLAAAYGALGLWDLEIEACEKALQLDPDFQLAKNNLSWAKRRKAEQEKK